MVTTFYLHSYKSSDGMRPKATSPAVFMLFVRSSFLPRIPWIDSKTALSIANEIRVLM